jgi:hypothetical protein
MMIHWLLLAASLLAPFASIGSGLDPSPRRQLEIESPSGEESGPMSGLITTRLSPRQLERWQEIKQLAFAEDENGEPLHPILRGLWEWAELSQHAIYIEMLARTRYRLSLAGNFQVRQFDPRGKRHVAVIQISLSNIDRAYVGPVAARTNGFIPFQGLSKQERYAEVLGHELAHAEWILSDVERARKDKELVGQTNEWLLLRNRHRGSQPLGADLQQRLHERDSFLVEVEAHAETVEVLVWQELMASQQARARN